MKTKPMRYLTIVFLLGVFAACNNDQVPEGDLFTVSTVIAGEVTFKDTSEPAKEAKVYFNESGFDCENSQLGNPILYDSTTTNQEGRFSKKIDFLNMSGPLCIESFAIHKEGNEISKSDTISVLAPLKINPPFDSAEVNLMLD